MDFNTHRYKKLNTLRSFDSGSKDKIRRHVNYLEEFNFRDIKVYKKEFLKKKD
jgi:hypothetical protein